MQKGASIEGAGLILNWEDFCLLGDNVAKSGDGFRLSLLGVGWC